MQAQGFVPPFESGLRWIHSASLASPWIPTRVSFAGGGELVWVATEVSQRRLLVFDAPGSGVIQPALADDSVANASYLLAVEAGPDARRMFSLAQYAEPDLLNRRTVVSCHDALAPSHGAAFDSTWSFSFGFVGNGPAYLKTDAEARTVAVAAVADSASYVRVHRLDASTGTVLMARDLSGVSLDSFALSGDGQVSAVSIGRRLVVLDAYGNVLHEELLSGAAKDLALDADGSRLVVGSVGHLRVYDFDGAAYQFVHEHLAPSVESASQVAVSADGQTYAAAWYRFLSADELRCEVYDGSSHALVNSLVQSGVSAGLQNSPVDLEMTADGRRIAFAAWGQGNAAPEVFLLERGVAQPVLEIDLPGSAMGMDLDESGTRLALVTKNLHANQVGSTGEIRLYDTGERDLQLLAPARLGGTLEVASKKPGAVLALFLVGARSSAPASLPGMTGQLSLARTHRLRTYGRIADTGGRADLAVPIPWHSAMIGVDLSVQVANRVGGQIVFSDTVLDPLFY